MPVLVAPRGEVVEVTYPRWYAECAFPSYAVEVDTGVISIGRQYKGPYRVTPTEHAQTLPTMGLDMTQNIVVAPIPNNYGLISWDGSAITVS